MTLGLGILVVQAGGWENFKLRYFALTQVFNDQSRELGDLRAQQLDPAESTRIDLNDLLNGGPPKDGIPSIDDPQFDTAESTPFDAETTVIGLEINGEAKAYPFNIMNWHEIVNDVVGGVNVSVSYCPLCDTILAVERGNTTFGVSGKLFQSCLVMFDRSDDTLFAQPWALGIIGPQVNQSLDRIPAVKTTLGSWLDKYPESKILSTDTGHLRDYSGYPYGSYYTDANLYFPARNQEDLSLHPKEIVSYVWEADAATPLNEFSGDSFQFIHKQVETLGEMTVTLSGRPVTAKWDPVLETVRVEDEEGSVLPSSTAFAFVYPAFFISD